jgi:hypothetical protein
MKKTIAIATAYPIKSDAIVISKRPFSQLGQMLLNWEKSCNLRHSGLLETCDIRPHYSAPGPDCSL